ncbi:MAG: hypothetical protein K0Q77_361 [Anaerosporomusa subterranea]|jgi:CDGSH-type Zn-finger protein|nr:hypothetical protein [Anaerosporomusa subterranea]
MADLKIQVLDNGPNIVIGNADVVDADGKSFKKGEQWALCRCGLSKNMPFCDGSHQGKFNSAPRAK